MLDRRRGVVRRQTPKIVKKRNSAINTRRSLKKNDYESLMLSSSLRGNERGPEMGGSKTIKVNGARSKKGLETGRRTDEAQKGREGSDLKGGVCDIG